MNVLSNNKLKSLAAYRQQKNCEADGVFVVEGVKMAQEALKSGWHIRTICCTEEAVDSIGAAGNNVADELYVASREQLERLSLLRSPQGVWMLVERRCENGEPASPPAPLQRERGENNLVLALDGIQDPGNMGTILRTCDWFGVREVICSEGTVSCYNPKVVQASMGAIFRINVSYCGNHLREAEGGDHLRDADDYNDDYNDGYNDGYNDLAERLGQYKKHGYTVCGAMLDGENAFETLRNHRDGRTSSALRAPQELVPCVLVIGNEGHGISPEVAAVVDQRLTIPNIGGTCESLNAAVAAAILISGYFRI